MKKPPIARLKRKAWKVFSLWVRLHHGEYPRCVTCGTSFFYKLMHAGHFIHGHSKATFLDERNVHVQCIRCNHFLSGNLIEYVEFMRKTYGQETIDELRALSKQVWKPTRAELEAIIEKYKENKNGDRSKTVVR